MTIICGKRRIPILIDQKSLSSISHVARRNLIGNLPLPGGDSPVSYCFAASVGRFSETEDAVIAC